MQYLSSYGFGLGLIFSSALIAACNSSPVLDGDTTRSIESRQAPAVIATPDFLRRAYHACAFDRPFPRSVFELILHLAVVAGDRVYIDGGEFSFMNNGAPNYQYCTL